VKPGLLGKRPFRKTRLLKRRAKLLNKVGNHAEHKSISEYALQGQKHTSVCESVSMRDDMERTPDDRREILRAFIQERKLKIATWAKQSGVDKNSIYNFLNGHSQSLDLRTYAKLARTAEVPVFRLNGDVPDPPSPTVIWVSGYVEAGDFREAVEWDQSRWYSVDVPVPDRFRSHAKALEVRGNSMNQEYKPGAIIIWVDMLDYRPPRHLDHVVVYTERHDGQIEATVKELRVDDANKKWLWPKSDDPAHQVPIDLDTKPEGVKDVVVKGIVIGDYRQRAH
jgi:phage repressor protein C with HTH and peptisase S24 domain